MKKQCIFWKKQFIFWKNNLFLEKNNLFLEKTIYFWKNQFIFGKTNYFFLKSSKFAKFIKMNQKLLKHYNILNYSGGGVQNEMKNEMKGGEVPPHISFIVLGDRQMNT